MQRLLMFTESVTIGLPCVKCNIQVCPHPDIEWWFQWAPVIPFHIDEFPVTKQAGILIEVPTRNQSFDLVVAPTD